MLTTPIFDFPYPEGSDLVQEGNDVIQDLAEAIEAAMNPPWVDLAPLGTNYSQRAGYLAPAYRVRDDGQVQLRGGLTKSAAIITGDTLFTLPDDAWPTASVSLVIAVHRTGTTNAVTGRLDIATTGATTVHVIDAQAAVSIALDGAGFSRGLVFPPE